MKIKKLDEVLIHYREQFLCHESLDCKNLHSKIFSRLAPLLKYKTGNHYYLKY